MAAKRQYKTCLASSPGPVNQDSSNNTSAASSSLQPATATGSTSHSSSTAAQTSSRPSFAPTSDCSTLSSPYSALGSQFTLHCKTDFGGHDLMSGYVYHFEDCMRACVSYDINSATHSNSSCAGVAFGYTASYEDETFWDGNCFMKATSGIAGNVNDVSDAAC